MSDNRLRQWNIFKTNTSLLSVDSWRNWIERNAIDFNPDYQRDYVWGWKEQKEFLITLICGYPVGTIAISEDRNADEKLTKWVELIDGKQRITTLKLVFDGVIPLPIPDGSTLFWDELTLPEQRKFRNLQLPALRLDGSTYKERLEFFYRINFTGVPQSVEHMKFIEKKLGY